MTLHMLRCTRLIGLEEGQEDLYGPWLVVMRRKNGNKSPRRIGTVSTITYSGDTAPHDQVCINSTTFKTESGKEIVRDSKRKNPIEKSDIGPREYQVDGPRDF